MLAADALVSLGAQLATDERLRSLLDEQGQGPSAAHFDGTEGRDRKKSRRDASSLSATREPCFHEARVESGSGVTSMSVCALNNRALLCAARGEAVRACRLLRSAVLSSAPGQVSLSLFTSSSTFTHAHPSCSFPTPLLRVSRMYRR